MQLSIVTRSAVHAAVIAPDAHLWIRSQGTSLKTSPYALKPNEPFVPIGLAFFATSGYTSESYDPALFGWVPYYIRNLGMNVVRFGFEPGYKKNAILTVVPISEYLYGPKGCAAFVDLCKQASVYVILDAHVTMGEDKTGGLLWKDYPQVRQGWLDAWTAVATYFKDDPWVLGYEIANECMPGNGNDYIRQAYIDCVKAVRAVDTKHVIFVGCGYYNAPTNVGVMWNSVANPSDPEHNTIFNNNVAFMSHFYSSYDNASATSLTAFQDANNVPFSLCEIEYGSSSHFLIRDISVLPMENILDILKPRKSGWMVWLAGGIVPNPFDYGRTDLWMKRIAGDAPTQNPEPAAKIKFMNSNFTSNINEFSPGTTIGVQFEAPDINPSGIDSLQVELHGQKGSGYSKDAETLTLTETGANTGIFRNTIATAAGVATSSNNIVEVRTGNAETITASYGPYISTITKSNLTPLSVASMQLEVTCKGIGWPMTLQADGSCPAKVRATLLDSTGEIARYAAAPVFFSVSPAYAYVVGKNPVTPVNGVAETYICSSENPGKCTVTASGGASASVDINVVDYWYDMQVQKQDSSWSAANGAVAATDNPVPKCKATLQNLSGLELSTEGYEYSTDGGLSWSGISEDFSASALDPAKWRLHNSASKVTGTKGIRLTNNVANTHGQIEYVPGMDLASWRMRVKWGAKKVPGTNNSGCEFTVTFYSQDNYVSNIPTTGYQLVFPYTSTSNGNTWKAQLYRVTGSSRTLLAAQTGNSDPCVRAPDWGMTLDVGLNNGNLEMWMDGISNMGGYLIYSTTTFDSSIKGFSFGAKTGASNPSENWLYDVRLYNYLPGIPLYDGSPIFSGIISSQTRTTPDIAFSAGATAGMNKIKFIHYPVDDMSMENERLKIFDVNINVSNDSTPPSDVPAVRDGANEDVFSVNSASQLSANWDASADAESGIARYWYSIGTAPGTTNITAWTDTGTKRYVTTRGLSLTVGTTYYFSVKAENGKALMSNPVNSNGQYATLDLVPPVISNVQAKNISPTGTVITWDTDEQATSRVEYGVTTAYGSSTVQDNNLLVNHSENISGLLPNKIYHYRIISRDKADNEQTSDDYTFSTCGSIINAYPNPHDFTKGNPMTFIGTDSTGIEVKIFTISGRLVKKLSAPNGASSVQWSGKNEDGEKVRRGLYLAKVTSGSGATKICKIALTR